ncbi:N-acetyltransferase [Jannaschia sp. S6380]|uniref:GNAT family N-acetyltransferase n=1 Tax=Jannaschia sp. S6380 TaxID=2926408 RepID=UPI001FF4969A|nr:N-acetyltransferase [Jannaschia sp. S6380]MCK0167877.1 N-acetyltransferase [Jannaschia sp. S6380]
MLIRPEAPDDHAGIHAMTRAAFAVAPHADGDEPEIVDRLRADGDLALSLVAVDGALAGHVAFSPARLQVPGMWLALGPISVHPDRQRRGIGTALIETGLAQLRTGGAAGCVLLGDPDYYGRFGFCSDLGLTYADLPARHVQGLAFGAVQPTGPVRFAPAFG